MGRPGNSSRARAWLDTREGQKWLNRKHQHIHWGYGFFGEFKPIITELLDAPAYMDCSEPRPTEEELEHWTKTEEFPSDFHVRGAACTDACRNPLSDF
jgi:hypothetical protein